MSNLQKLGVIAFTLVLLTWMVNLGFAMLPSNKCGVYAEMLGISNSLFSGLAFAAVAITLYLQYRQSRIGSIQQFENTFFLLLGLHQQILQDIDIHLKSKKILKGRRCFGFLYKEYKKRYEDELKNSQENNVGIISTSYFDFYEKRQDKLAHYFQTLYNLIKHVDEAGTDIDKKKYVNIVRAQLSVYELGLIFYNCIAELGREKFKPLIEKYSLFKNMPKSILHDENHPSLYDQSAFYGAPNWTATRKFSSDEEEFSHNFDQAVTDLEEDQ